MDQAKIERLLGLMKMMSGNVNYTIDELAEKLGTSYRSIYRYIDTFKESGFVVEKLHSNVYKLGFIPSDVNEIFAQLLDMCHTDIFEVKVCRLCPEAHPER